MANILQKYRDYELTLTNPDTGKTLVIINDYMNGKGLRISFNMNLIAPYNLFNNANGNVCQFSIKIYNLSPANQKKINTGAYTQVFLSVGYRELLNGGQRSTQPILIGGTVYNSFTHRESATEIVTELLGLKDSDILNQRINAEDENKYAKQYLVDKPLSRKDIFLSFINTYFTNNKIIIDDKSFDGFDDKYNVLDPTKIGFTFNKGTTVAKALGTIAGDRLWYVDSVNRLTVTAKPSNKEDVKPLYSANPTVLVNQKSGMLGVPILAPSKKITVKTLINPLITPNGVVKISTRDGFRQQGLIRPVNQGTSTQATTYSEREYTAVVMTANFKGDSKDGQWITEFETYPVDSVKIDGGVSV